jgi:hypothetical protein
MHWRGIPPPCMSPDFLFFDRQVRFGSWFISFHRGSLDSTTAHSYCVVFRLGASRLYTSLLLYVRRHFASPFIKFCSLSSCLLEWTARHMSTETQTQLYHYHCTTSTKPRRRTHPCLIFYAYPPNAPAQPTLRRRRVLALADPNGRHHFLSPQTPFLTANIIPHTWPASPLDSTRNAHTSVHTQRTASVHPHSARGDTLRSSKQASPRAQALAVVQGQLPR